MGREKAKEIIGGKVLSSFESKITEGLFSERKFREQIDAGSRLAEEMPFVTQTFRENGILRQGEGNAKIIHVFRPNLWAQDVAYREGKLSKMTIHTSQERADSSVEYVLTHQRGIFDTLRESGKSVYDFSDAFRKSTLIEAAYYTILSGVKIPVDVEKRMKTALMRRLVSADYDFRQVARIAGVEYEDRDSLIQFAEDIELIDLIREAVAEDPYFRRRNEHIESFKEINSAESIKRPQKMSEKMSEGIMRRLVKKYPAMARKIFEQDILAR